MLQKRFLSFIKQWIYLFQFKQQVMDSLDQFFDSKYCLPDNSYLSGESWEDVVQCLARLARFTSRHQSSLFGNMHVEFHVGCLR